MAPTLTLSALGSDHTVFEGLLPVAKHYETDASGWEPTHTADDTLDKIQPLVVEHNGELATAVVYELAKNPALSARKAATVKPPKPGSD